MDCFHCCQAIKLKRKGLKLTFSLGHWSEIPLVTKDTSGAPKQYNWLNDIKIIRL